MTQKGKLILCELLSGVFGWIWIGAGIAALVFAGLALFGEWSWWSVLSAVIVSGVAKSLTMGAFWQSRDVSSPNSTPTPLGAAGAPALALYDFLTISVRDWTRFLPNWPRLSPAGFFLVCTTRRFPLHLARTDTPRCGAFLWLGMNVSPPSTCEAASRGVAIRLCPVASARTPRRLSPVPRATPFRNHSRPLWVDASRCGFDANGIRHGGCAMKLRDSLAAAACLFVCGFR